MKTVLIILSLLAGPLSYADDVYLDQYQLVRWLRDGSPYETTFNGAVAICPVGTHVPTVREFAVDSMKYGSKGIIEVGDIVGGQHA